jgi:xanthine dehydrogenase small subunit
MTMADSRPIRFLLNGDVVEVAGTSPSTTLLEWLRTERRATGTKEGCAEGDCGACTVVLARRGPDGALKVEPCNACIRQLPTVDGAAVLTVEGLGGSHPVQRAMVQGHGSQCGFCTPGFVMAMVAALAGPDGQGRSIDSPEAACDALAGNLCRCTGYRPIVDALLGVSGACDTVPWLEPPPPSEPLRYAAGGLEWHAPRDPESVDALLADHPDAWLLAGGTDIGLWVTKQLREPVRWVWLGAVDALAHVGVGDDGFDIGAAVSLADAFAALSGDYPEFDRYWSRFASPSIRASGTLVGNLANGSPIGDAAPVLIALGATLVLRRRGDDGTTVRRTLPLESLYLDYRVQDRAPGEWIERVVVPRRASERRVAAWKLSKRIEQDISAVSLGVALSVVDDRLADVRIAFGGMAGTVRRAAKVEAALQGLPARAASFDEAAAQLAQDFSPLSDMRASAGYRLEAGAGLLRRTGLVLFGNDVGAAAGAHPVAGAGGAGPGVAQPVSLEGLGPLARSLA